MIETLSASVPGTSVPSGAQVAPGGSQGVTGATGVAGPTGPQGVPAATTTTAAFTVPPVGSTTTVTVANASWVVNGQMVYVDTAGGGIGQAGTLQVTGISGNQLTLLNPPMPSSIPLANSSTSGLLKQVSGKTTDFVDGTNNCQSLASALTPTIRGYNSLGNPNFEVDARTAGAGTSTLNTFALDRWKLFLKTTMAGTCVQNSAPSGIIIPGTIFCISDSFLRFTLTTAQASLAASDFLFVQQSVEGTRFRELLGGTTTGTLVARSSIAGTTFSMSLRDAPAAYSCVQLGTIPTANVWTPVILPSFVTWTPNGTFNLGPGQIGYQFAICLAAGSSFIAPAANVWNSGNLVAAPGQGNFAANPVGSTFDLAFAQFEPGSNTVGILDKDFDTNLSECERYYEKSYAYNVAVGTAASPSYQICQLIAGNVLIRFNKRYRREKATTPTVTIWNPTNGTINQIYQESPTQVSTAISGSVACTTAAIRNASLATAASGTAGTTGYGMYEFAVDTGW